MTMLLRFPTSRIAATAVAMALSVFAFTTARADAAFTQATFAVSNRDGNSGHGALIGNSVGAGSPASSTSGTASFSGLNSSGALQTMTVSGSGSASASAGALHTFASLTLETPYYNAANQAYVDQDFGINSSGSPDLMEVFSVALFADRVAINSAAVVSTLRVSVELTGGVSYSNSLGTSQANGPAFTEATLLGVQANGNSCGSCGLGRLDGQGTFAQVYIFDMPVADMSAANLSFVLYINDQFDLMQTYDESANYSMSMDFSHGAQIIGIQGLDSAGQEVALNSVTGLDGTAYAISAVPEASQSIMFAAGLGLLSWAVRRRKPKTS